MRGNLHVRFCRRAEGGDSLRLEPVMNLATDGGLEPSSDRTQTSRILVSCGSDAGS